KKQESPQPEARQAPEPVHVKRQAPAPLPEPSWNSLPPVRREQRVLHSAIEDRSMESKISNRKLASSINERGSPMSAGMLEHIDTDPSYALQSKKKSRAKHLLGTRSSLRRALLMKEIFSPPQL
ncbi:MAG: hypothetical protein V4492_06575, partial [Chlamydiota bacterium]